MRTLLETMLALFVAVAALSQASAEDGELAEAKAAHAATIHQLDDALAQAERAHANGVAAAHRTLLQIYDRAIRRAVDRGDRETGDHETVEALRTEKQALAAEIPRAIQSLGDDVVLECVLGVYGQAIRGKRYPFANLRPPQRDLWTEAVQEKLAGKISFGKLDYIATALLVIPADGWYTIELPERGTQFRLNGKQLGSGHVQLLRGVYDVEIYTNTWGQPYLPACYAAVFGKDTRQHVPLVNTAKAVAQFLRQRIDGRRVVEVSGYQPQVVDVNLAGAKR